MDSEMKAPLGDREARVKALHNQGLGGRQWKAWLRVVRV